MKKNLQNNYSKYIHTFSDALLQNDEEEITGVCI